MSSQVKTVTKCMPLSRDEAVSGSMVDEFLVLKKEACRQIDLDIKMICDQEDSQPVGVKYTDSLAVDGHGATLKVVGTFTTRAKPKVE